MGKSNTTELQVFSGGLNLLPVEHLIAKEEARYLANSNTRHGNLTPFLVPLFQEVATANFVFFFDAQFQYYPMWRSNVLFNNVWYFSDARELGKRYTDGTEYPLGIAPPVDRLTTTAVPSSANVDGLTGLINYVYTYYDPISGSESPPSPPSKSLDLTGVNAKQAIQIDAIVPSPLGYQTRLYRIGGNITAYSAVIKLSPAEITYTDELSFSEIEAVILTTTRAYPPPVGLQYLTQHQGRFYGAVDTKLYFTPPGKPDSWYLLDYIGFNEAITGIVSVANGVIIMSRTRSWLLTGNTPLSFTKHTLSDSEGCISAPSIAVNDGTAIWLSYSGFVMSNGSNVVNISLDKLGRFKSITPVGAAFIDKRYFLSFVGVLLPSNVLHPSDDLYPGMSVNDTGIALPPGAIVIDMSKGAPSFSTLIDEQLGALLVANNDLYQVSSVAPVNFNLVLEDGTANLTTESGRFNITAATTLGKSLEQSLNGKDLRVLSYRSPMLTEGSVGTLKQYEKVRLVYRGSLTMVITNDSNEVLQTVEFNSLTRKSEWIGIPVTSNRGYGIQFNIVGKCVIDSIMYNWTQKEAQ